MKRNKVILVNPGIQEQGIFLYGSFPNTAIMTIASILDLHGFQVKIIDGKYLKVNDAIQHVLHEIDETVIFVGFSIMTMQAPYAYKICEAIKAKHQNVPIVWGGVHPTLFPEQTVEDPMIDIVIQNEAHGIIVDLTRRLALREELSDFPGIAFKQKSQVIKTPPNKVVDDFHNTPYINFDLMNHQRYARNNIVANEEFYGGRFKNDILYPVLTGLGCSYKCTFCINVIIGKSYLFRTSEELIERIKFLKRKYGATFIQPLDENFFINRKRVFRFIELLEKEQLSIKWRPQMRPDYFSEEFINVKNAKRLDRVGMIVAAMGVESASQEMLDKIKKQLKVEQIIKAMEILSQTNIVSKMNFMVGMPGENEEDIKRTFQLALQLRRMSKKSCITVNSFRPYPGSPLYDMCVNEYGYKSPSNLKDWIKLSEKEFSESDGYESYDQYKWIKNRRQFKRMLLVYSQAAWYRSGFVGNARVQFGLFRFKYNFFLGVFLETWIRRKLSKIRYLLKSFLSQNSSANPYKTQSVGNYAH